MADVKVSGLPQDSSLDNNHYIPVNDPSGPTTKRTLLSTLASFFFNQSNIPAGADSPVTRADDLTSDFVLSGLVWSGDAYASTRNASMTSGVVYINGLKISIASVTARSFTASKDTYVDVLSNGDGTGTLVYTEVTNGAASPALAANSIRLAKIVTGASNILNAASIVQSGADGNTSASNMINPRGSVAAAQVQPKTYVDSNGWSTYIHAGTGKRRYYRSASWSTGSLASGLFTSVSLGITYPTPPYRLVYFTVRANDQAVSATAGVNGNILVQSHYTSVTPTGDWQMELEET